MAQMKHQATVSSDCPEGAARVVNWKQYEQEICDEFRLLFPDANILQNQRMHGRAGGMRQIDVLIRERVAGRTVNIVVDGKCFSRKVDVGVVESFAGLVRDVRADKGVIVTNVGYTDGALKRAQSEQGMELDILPTDPIEPGKFQSKIGFPYSDSRGVVLIAPFGWVVDGKRRYGIDDDGAYRQKAPAFLYQRGESIDRAPDEMGFGEADLMYVQFWTKGKKEVFNTLKKLLDKQEDDFLRYPPEIKVEISYVPLFFARKDGAEMHVRKARIERPGLPVVLEYTGFVDFPDFIFFVVLLTSEKTALRNVGKLEYVIEKVMPMRVQHEGQRR